MAREAYRSVYGDLTKLKDDSVLKDPAAGPDDDDELFELLLAVSDWIDRYCNRHFYPRLESLLFDGGGGDRLAAPDLIAVIELAEADAAGRAFGRIWDAADYRLLPYNAAPQRPWGHPYGAIRAQDGDRGFPSGAANFRVQGLWGYRMFAELSGAALAAEAAADDTTLAVSDGGQFREGQTILPGGLPADPPGDAPTAAPEQALVTAVNGNTLTVARGLNGTAPAAHAAAGAVGILRWPPSVERAALIQTARIWTRAADFEPFYVDADVDTDVRLLLEPYRKPPGP